MDDDQAGGPATGEEAGGPRQYRLQRALTVQDMVLAALEQAHKEGGVGYLTELAQKHPTVFLTLVGKVLPLQARDDSGATLIGRVVFRSLND